MKGLYHTFLSRTIIEYQYIIFMKLHKGMILQFKDRSEKILSVKNCRISGNIVTERQTYSTDFICRWIDFEFIKVLNND